VTSPGPASDTSDAKVAIITAAADGIGRATALAFRRAGYRLALVDIDAAGLERTAQEAGSEQVSTIVADVTEQPDTQRIASAAVEAFGRIDALVNVVGGSRPGKSTIELSLEEWNRLLALNLTSVFLMCQAVLPHLERAGHGAVVNVSSGAGLRGMQRNPGYVAAKAGVAALTRALAIDHGPQGVRVNCVAPGPIRTPLMRRNRTPDEIAAMGSLAIAGRIGEPEEIAAAILWLAGDESSYVMGQTLAVDGGVASLV
jgi:NAD(P)-dependent dehydrogenase (short-subunit alcohol dehydrogenase family)